MADVLLDDRAVLELGQGLLAEDFEGAEMAGQHIAASREPRPGERVNDVLPLAGLLSESWRCRGKVHRLAFDKPRDEALCRFNDGLRRKARYRQFVGAHRQIWIAARLGETLQHPNHFLERLLIH